MNDYLTWLLILVITYLGVKDMVINLIRGIATSSINKQNYSRDIHPSYSIACNDDYTSDYRIVSDDGDSE